jgi:AcrR family transcriptional regulator
VATRTRLEVDQRRLQLLEAGLELFGRRPYGEVSMEELARAAGVSHGLVYHYFGSKQGYLRAVVEWVTGQLVAETTPDPETDPLAQLFQGLDAHVSFAERYPAGYALVASGANGADEQIQAICEEARRRTAQNLLASLKVTRPPARLRIAVRGWQGFVEGAITEWIRGGQLPRKALIEMMIAMLPAALEAGGYRTSTARGVTPTGWAPATRQ